MVVRRPPSRLHHAFVATEVTKLVSLLAIGVAS
jgi:hypothetical protein